ncbi:hypothetical protein EYM_07135 [Ignicoccus islandicus DSM 13165]|uniref:Glycosyltransferase subfamily 4-like N-terminal domain-containing protein n=1 Tax=Ignicoccus islandicus DSM 13165 TaxID=940295 RepID=A0A0U3FTF3_9CREN|nr:glycosyltransferase family 4 protein [Ignicoccus islandicus]ALU12752.1 hypothetical protein EYM_07135 [Ignicoccus islandicus DSM 13165]
MKIAYVTRRYWPYVKGGSEKFAKKVVERLKARGHDVKVVTLASDNSEEVIGIRDPFKGTWLSSVYFSIMAPMVLRKLKPDAVIVNAYWAEFSPILEEFPTIYLIHDAGLLELSSWKYKPKSLLMKASAMKSDLVVVPLSYTKRLLVEKLGIPESKIRVLGGEGVEGPFKYVKRDNGFFNVVQVARFAPNKGQLDLIDAFKESLAREKAKLWLVGTISDTAYFEKVLKKVREVRKEYGDIVKVVPNAKSVNPYYELADVCVNPSIHSEGFGLSLVECMAFGKPVIASEIFKKIGTINEEEAITFKDLEDLKAKLRYVYENYNEVLNKYGIKGLEKAKKLSWDEVVEKLEKWLKEIAR